MKRITLLYALAATLMVCSGCSDFLEEHNRSAVTTISFPMTKQLVFGLNVEF